MYFVSNRNLDAQNDSIFLIHITDTIGSASQTLTAMPYVSNRKYFVPPPASQPGPGVQLLETNDSRILGAFLENGKIQFVGNCLDTASGNSAVYHGVINNLNTTPLVTANVISDTLLEFGYPNISYIGNSVTDNTAAINFNHSALTVFPGVSALIADDNGNYSPLLTIKTGVNYISILSGNERWGDYSGSQRKYNDTGMVWLNGMFGNASKRNTTWIGQLALTNIAGVGVPEKSKSINEMLLFPNPTTDVITASLSLETTAYLNFEIYDITGKLVKVLLREKVKAGKNNFSFSTNPLSKGIYFLKVSSSTNEFLSEKFIKE